MSRVRRYGSHMIYVAAAIENDESIRTVQLQEWVEYIASRKQDMIKQTMRRNLQKPCGLNQRWKVQYRKAIYTSLGPGSIRYS